MTLSKKIIKMWEKEGWKYTKTETGFNFQIEFPFAEKFIRIITVYFETEPRKYYYIDVRVTDKEKSGYAYETLYVEPKEHMLIHNTLLDLKWI